MGQKHNGYGRIRSEYRLGREIKIPTHLYAWEHFNGPLPAGYVLDHLCQIKTCVNPSHLEAVTVQENTRRGNRHPPVTDHHRYPWPFETAQLGLWPDSA
jgi:hypothetical protein